MLKQFERFQAPFASMVHDFMATRDHVLFPILPLTGNMERARRGLPPSDRGRDGAIARLARRLRPR